MPFDIKKWIPQSELEKMNDVKTLSSQVVKSDFGNAVSTVLAEEFRLQERAEQALDRIDHLAKDGKTASKKWPAFEVYTGAARCQNKATFPKLLSSRIDLDLQKLPVVDKYVTDTYLKHTGVLNNFFSREEEFHLGEIQGVDPLMRFVMESRGIAVDGLDMQATGGTYQRSLNNLSFLLNALYELEPADSKLKIFKDFSYSSSAPKSEICDKLMEMSFSALSKPDGAQSPNSKADTIR